MKILVGMSGGLDSTYAVRKLLDEVHEVEGAVVKMHEYTELSEDLPLKINLPSTISTA